MVQIKSLQNLQELAETNCPEFLETIQEKIIKPFEEQGAKFRGMSITGDQESSNPIGAYLLIFNAPRSKGYTIPEYQDEGTSSFSYKYYGDVYIIIPMPY